MDNIIIKVRDLEEKNRLLKDRALLIGENLVETRANGYSNDFEIDEMQNRFSGRSQVQIIDELLVLLKTKTIDLKSKGIKLRLKLLRTLLRKLKL